MVNLAKNNHTTKNEKDRKEYIDIKCLCQNDTPVWFQQRFQQQQKKNKKRRTNQANQHWKTGRGIKIKDEKKVSAVQGQKLITALAEEEAKINQEVNLLRESSKLEKEKIKTMMGSLDKRKKVVHK